MGSASGRIFVRISDELSLTITAHDTKCSDRPMNNEETRRATRSNGGQANWARRRVWPSTCYECFPIPVAREFRGDDVGGAMGDRDGLLVALRGIDTLDGDPHQAQLDGGNLPKCWLSLPGAMNRKTADPRSFKRRCSLNILLFLCHFERRLPHTARFRANEWIRPHNQRPSLIKPTKFGGEHHVSPHFTKSPHISSSVAVSVLTSAH